MSTCQSVINVALEKLGIIEIGGTPEAAHTTAALKSLKGYFQKLINSGTFGRLNDSIPPSTTWEASENERIIHDGSVTVTLPTELPYYQEQNDYGMVSYVADYGNVRPPMDMSIVSIVNTTTGAVLDYIYDNRVREWIEINALEADDDCPLSHRDEDGLACALVLRLASQFGQQAAPEIAMTAARFEEALTHNWSQAAEVQEPKDFY